MVSIDRLRLKDMILKGYESLSNGLVMLPLPLYFKFRYRIRTKKYSIPKTLEEFSDAICYGQKLYLSQPEPNDYGIILRMIAGYYYSIVTGNPWDEKKIPAFSKQILYCKVIDLYPIAMRLSTLMSELTEREQKALRRDPSDQEKKAGIDKLSKYSALSALLFLQDSFKMTEKQVMNQPYNDCLVRFMYHKDQQAFEKRLMEVHQNEAKKKKK